MASTSCAACTSLLTGARKYRGDELAVILAGRAGPLRGMLHASPALAARFPATIDFPGYTPAQLTAILHALAAEAGLTLTPDAARKAAAVLTAAENGHATGNARLAVQLLTQATTSQAHRVTAGPGTPGPAALATINAADFPGHLPPPDPPAHDQPPGQYL
jgi:AAA lid domain